MQREGHPSQVSAVPLIECHRTVALTLFICVIFNVVATIKAVANEISQCTSSNKQHQYDSTINTLATANVINTVRLLQRQICG